MGKIFKKFRKITAVSLVLATIPFSAARLNAQGSNYTFADRTKVFSANVLFNGLVSGIGATRRNKPFLENLAKGALGGLLISSGNYMVAKEENLMWPAKIISNAGASISYNVSRGQRMLDNLGMEIGPLYLQIGKGGFEWYVIPGSIAGIVGGITRGADFSLEETLRFGTPVFYDSLPIYTDSTFGMRYGLFGTNVLLFDPRISIKGQRHDLVHINQIQAQRSLNSLLPKRYSKIENFLLRNHVDVRTIPGDISNNLQDFLLGYGYSLGEWEARVFSGAPKKLDAVLQRN